MPASNPQDPAPSSPPPRTPAADGTALPGHGRDDRPDPAWLRWLGRGCFALLVVEVLLQVVRPTALERVRDLTFPVARRDATFITLQRHNFDGPDHRPLLRFDPDLFWRMIPDQQGSWFGTDDVRVNSVGLRSPEVGPRGENEVRLLFLGDSITFGMGVDEHERYSERLLAALAERHPEREWSLINAGCVGYTSWQGLRWLAMHGEPMEVDAVVAAFGVNDVMLRPLSDERFSALLAEGDVALRLGLRQLQLVAAGEVAAGLWARSRDTDPRALHTYLWYPRQLTGQPPVPRVHRGLPLIALSGFAAVVPVVLLGQDSWPGHASASVLDEEYAMRLAAHADFWAQGEEDADFPTASLENLHWIDLRGELSAGADDPAGLFSDWCHPSAAGHARLAERLLTEWDARGITARLAAAPGER